MQIVNIRSSYRWICMEDVPNSIINSACDFTMYCLLQVNIYSLVANYKGF